MGKSHHPRRGSLQYWPHKRAKRIYPQVPTRKTSDTKLVAFPTYKAGMTHIIVRDERKKSARKNMDVAVPVTILEVPKINAIGFRVYKMTEDGLKIHKDFSIKTGFKADDIKSFSEVRVLVSTNPKVTSRGQKNSEIFEVPVGGKKEEILAYVQKLMETKEVAVRDIFKEGDLVDVKAVTTGRGFRGVIWLTGSKLRHHKSEKGIRRIGSIGPWHPNKLLYYHHFSRKHGFFNRTEYNKLIYKIGDSPEDVNIPGGFVNYGNVKNTYVLIKGSVPGPKKRLIMLIKPLLQKQEDLLPIKQIVKSSHQS